MLTAALSILLLVALVGFGLALAAWLHQRRAALRLARDAASLGRGGAEEIDAARPGAVGVCAAAFQRAIERREEQRRALEGQRNELEALLASMAEGVVAVDRDERVLRVNPTAAALLGVDPAAAAGRTVPELARSTALIDLLQRALAEDEPAGAEIEYHAGTEEQRPEKRWLRAEGTALTDAEGRRIGALVVLHEVTRLRRLESVRRDFVANVSHELRTPVTTIKGFVETLRDDPGDDPQQTARFLEIVGRQAERLEALVTDLFTLAQVEGAEQIEKRPTAIAPLLESAVEACHAKIAEHSAHVETTCPPGLSAEVNESLFEQVVVNLLDNAVKHSPESGRVDVEATKEAGELVVAVRDQGPGIEAEHQQRLFERFYRADRARSRALGGTGLGLAIVKHIAQAHGGRVELESQVGAGSTFRVRVPAGGTAPTA